MNCSCINQNASPAVISATLAAGSTTTPYYIMANITQQLCEKCCTSSTPVFKPSFSVLGYDLVGTEQYVVTIHVEGIISYIPCGKGACCMRSQLVSQNFTLPMSATGVTGVTVTAGATVNAVYTQGCQTCGRTFVSETPLTIAVATE